jgi:excisionase family DNA binding protein
MEGFMQHANDNCDLLIGANAIADTLGITRRQAYKLIYAGDLPTFKLGGSVAARRSTLNAWLTGLEQGRAAA